MWETSGYDNEELLWAGFGLYGGIAGKQQATCGALAAAAVYLGLRHRIPLSKNEEVKNARAIIEKEAFGLAKEFIDKFGSTICIDLVKMDLGDPSVRQKFRDEGISAQTCDQFVQFVIDKMYALEERRT